MICKLPKNLFQNIAYEFFRYNQTQATLPYIKNQSGIVTTANKDLTSSLMKMDKKKFNKEMENSFNNYFGKMKLLGKRYSYPMITTYTKKFTSNRFEATKLPNRCVQVSNFYDETFKMYAYGSYGNFYWITEYCSISSDSWDYTLPALSRFEGIGAR